MTGDEYFSLKRGNNVTVETSFSDFTKGQVLKVEYIDNTRMGAYLRNISKPLGSQIDVVPVIFLLDNFVVGGKLPEKKNNNKVFELPFAIGDKVWFIVDNEVHEGTLTKCNIAIDKNGTQICYNVLYYSRIHYKVEAKGIASNKLFKTKTELLESL